MDLLHPAGGSINDGIETDLCSLKYPSVDDAVRKLLAKTPGTLMPRWTSRAHTGMSQYTQMTGRCWACDGETAST